MSRCVWARMPDCMVYVYTRAAVKLRFRKVSYVGCEIAIIGHFVMMGGYNQASSGGALVSGCEKELFEPIPIV